MGAARSGRRRRAAARRGTRLSDPCTRSSETEREPALGHSRFHFGERLLVSGSFDGSTRAARRRSRHEVRNARSAALMRVGRRRARVGTGSGMEPIRDAVISQAVGVLIAAHSTDPDEALRMIERTAAETGVTVEECARRIVANFDFPGRGL